MPDRYIVIHRVHPHPVKPTPAEVVDTSNMNMVIGYFPDRTVARKVAELLNADHDPQMPAPSQHFYDEAVASA